MKGSVQRAHKRRSTTLADGRGGSAIWQPEQGKHGVLGVERREQLQPVDGGEGIMLQHCYPTGLGRRITGRGRVSRASHGSDDPGTCLLSCTPRPAGVPLYLPLARRSPPQCTLTSLPSSCAIAA